MSRLPIRLKLTLAFACLMALLLAGTGLFLYLRFDAQLDQTVNQGLRSRAGDLSALVKQADSGLSSAGRSPLTERDEDFAQILDPGGEVLDATPQLREGPLIGVADARRAARGPLTVEGTSPFDRSEPVRLLAAPVDAQGRRVVVVVGASLDDNREALRNLALLLAIGGPIALLLASLAGYGLASAALRPVEAMRRKAAAITEHEPGARLPLPASDDEITRLGETLNAMLARLEGALERERTFVADASHELRTPLAILKAELELALREGRSPGELTAAIASAAEETDRLAQLAEDLLVIARSDQGLLRIRAVPVDAADLLQRVKGRFERRASSKARHLTAEAPAALTLQADSLRLEQALSNLIENALRHGAGRIGLSAETHNGRAELHVRDDGPGFPPEFLEHAFERFSRGDRGLAAGGSGLGLAIARAVARAHGGEAHAANDPRGGADVWIELPSQPSAQREERASAAVSGLSEKTPSTPRA